MKKFLVFLLLFPVLALADAVIFSGTDVKALKQNLDLFGVVKVLSGSLDPSAGGGVIAPIGSAYLSTAHGLFIKTGAGNTAWTKNALLPVDLATQVSGILATANGGTGSSNLGTGIVKASSGTLSTGTVDLTSNVSGILPVANGGTNLSTTPTNGQLLIGNGTNYTLSGLTGTANQVSITNGAGSITLSTPQNIATTSNVQFANLNATGTTTLNSGLTGPLKASSGVVSSSAINLASEVTGTLPIANGGTGSATQNFVDLTTNQTVAGEKTFSNTLKSDSIQTTGSSGVVIKNSSGTTVAEFGPANTTNASIAGGLNVGGNVTGANLSGTNTGDLTTGGDNDTPATTATIVAPNKQFTLTNTNQYRLNTGNFNELENASFEHSTVATGWTISNATASGSSSAIEGKKSISLALTGALSLSQSSTINAAQKANVQMVASIWVNSSDVSDLQLCSLKNGSEDKCTVSGGYVQGSGWRPLTVPVLGDSTSNGLKLKSTDTTGTVLVDQAFVGVGSPIVDFTPDMVYSVKLSGTSFSDENISGWVSSVAQSGTNNQIKTLTIPSGIFSNVPNCQCTINEATTASDITCKMNVAASTATSLVFHTSNNGSAAAQNPIITCQKQGADYKTSKAYVASSSDYGWTTYTPTVTGLGTVSSLTARHKRVGDTLFIEGSMVVGTPTATEARVSLPSGLTSSSVIGTLDLCGDAGKSQFSAADFRLATLCEPNVSYVTFGTQTSSTAITSKVNGDSLIGASSTFKFNARVPIAGWENSSVIVGSFQGYNETQGVSNPKMCSFFVSNAIGVENVCSSATCVTQKIKGNCATSTSVTRSGGGRYTYTFPSNYWTDPANVNCTVQLVAGGNGRLWPYTNSLSSTIRSISFDDSSAAGVDASFTVICHGN